MAQKLKPLRLPPTGKPNGGGLPTPPSANISATKVDAWDDTATPDGKAEPGQTVTYTVTITNTGATPATGVTFTDSVDTNTTLVPGSIQTQPVTVSDTYTASGNIQIARTGATGLLANDVDPDTGNNTGLTVSKVQGAGGNVGVATDTTAVGRGSVKGSVTVQTDGSFTYEPPPGFNGADTFTYEVTDGTNTDSSTVTINITGMVWFISNNGGGLNRGTFSNPFTSIAAFNTANAASGVAPDPKNADFIALRTGTGTYTEADGVNLRAQQKLIGEGVAFNTAFTADANSSSAYTTFAGAAGTSPNIVTTAGNGIDLSTDNTVRGLNVGNTPGFFKINGTAVGSPTINTVDLTGTGGALNVSTSGTFASNVTFGIFESTSSPGANLNLVGVTGTLGITSAGTGLSGSNAASNAVNVSGGTVSFTYSGNVTKANAGALVNIVGGHNTGTITFQTGTLSATSGTGFQFDNADGTYNFNGTNTMNGGDAGIDILNGSGGSFTFSASSTITSPTGFGFNVGSAPGTPTVTYSGTITDNTTGQVAVIVNGTTGGSVSIATVNTSTVAGGTGNLGVSINNANGNVTFTNLNLGTSLTRMTNDALNITGGTGTYNLGTLSIFTASGALGIDALNADGTINSTGGTVDASNGTAISIDGPAGITTLGMTLGTVNSSGGANNISLIDDSGSITIGAGALSGATVASFSVNAGTVSATYSGGITQANNAAMVNISGGHTGGTITFQTGTLNASNGTGLQFDNADGTYNFNGTTTLNGGDAGIDITTGSGGTFAFSTNTAITNPSGIAYNEDTSTANVTYNGTITKNNNANNAVNINAKTGGTTAFNRATGGQITASTTTANAIDLTNTGGTVSFTGGLSLTTTTGIGFNATGSGATVNATQDNSTIVNTISSGSGTGTALNVVNSTIGASGLTFRSISANGATNGIILNSTGASGGLTVTGQSTTAGSGGTIQNNVQGALFTSTNNLSLSNMNFTNPNSGNGTVNNIDGPTFNSGAQAGINMSSVSTVSFTNLNVNGNGGSGGAQVGINGQTVSNLTITNSTVSGFGDAATEGDVKIFNLTGTCSITNSTFGFAAADATAGEQLIDIRNNTGTLTLSATGNTFNDTRTSSFGGTQLMVTSVSTATVNLSIFNNDFLKAKTSGVETFTRDTSTMNVNITDGGTVGNGNVFDRQGGLSRAIGLNAEDTAHLNFNVNRNSKIYGSGGPVVNVFGINTAVINGRINNNGDIQGGGVGSVGSAINIHPEDSSSAIVEVIGNTISQIGSDPGVFAFSHGDGGANHSATLDVTIQSNTVTIAGTGVAGNGVVGIDTRAGSNANDTIKTCVDVQSNAVTLGQPADDIAWLTREGSTTPNVSNLYLEGMVAGATNQARATNTWNGRSNTPLNSVLAFDAGSSAAYSAPPAGAPYSGVCRSPGNANAMLEMRPAPQYFVAQNNGGSAITAVLSQYGRLTQPASITTDTSVVLDKTAFNRLAEVAMNGANAIARQSALLTHASVSGEANAERQAATTTTQESVARSNSRVTSERNEVKLNHAKSSTSKTADLTHAAPLTPGAGGTVNVTIGTLAPGDSVTITFQVVVDNPYSGGPNVSNQGSVSGSNPGAFTNLTDDPAVGGATDPTLTPINSINIGINNANQAEPASPNTVDMVFTVSLSSPATGAVSVNFTTANDTATSGTCGNPGADYVLTSGMVSFTAGQQVKTINVPICSDAAAEGDETFFVNLSGATGGTLVDNQAVGTITANTPGTFLISEIRTSGPGGLGDDFVELYNNTNSPLTVAASDASAGYGLFKMGADCNATPVLIGTIPNGTVIPARGHYLVVGSQYTLANYGGTGNAAGNLTMTSDIESDRNVSVFTTANIVNISSVNRLDAVGFGTNTGAVCDLLREPANLPTVSGSTTEHSFFRKECLVSGVGCTIPGTPKDANDNAADFMFADTQGTFISGVSQRLGAPGPENLASPIKRDPAVAGTLLDPSVSKDSVPNRVRDFTSNPGNNSTFGTLSVRRRFQNNTGANVTRLRFRIVQFDTFPSPGGGVADLRAITSVNVSVSGVMDAATCTAAGAGAPPCTITVKGTTMEQPPSQPNGGGFNSTMADGTITLGTPLAPGASSMVQFMLGIQTTGSYHFTIIVEALP
jgi:hypothetical protein